jgi:hypothetical protein
MKSKGRHTMKLKRILLYLQLLLLAALPGLVIPSSPVLAQSGNVWSAYFYNSPDWTGYVAHMESVPLIAYNWGTGSPAPSVPQDLFSASFVSQAFFYAGTYRFTTTADAEVALMVDNVIYLDTRGQGQAGKSQVVDIDMWQGNHQIQILYREYTEVAYVYVTWSYLKPPYAPTPTPPIVETTPPSSCTPQSVASLQTQYGDYTSCIANGLHQSACFQSSGQWDSPNLGSIETEPPIRIWMACTPDSVATFPVSCDPDVPPEEFKCSKTGAGYYPN